MTSAAPAPVVDQFDVEAAAFISILSGRRYKIKLTHRPGAMTLDNPRHSFWQCLILLPRLLKMRCGLTLQPEKEPTQVQIRSRGNARLWMRALGDQVVRSRAATGYRGFTAKR
jgi:hypothetical protein